MINRFQKLVVWKKSHQYVLQIYKISSLFPEEERYGITSQIKRAALSISANIVEGNIRRTKKDFIHFLIIAKGSLEETKYFLIVAQDLHYINEKEMQTTVKMAEDCEMLLNGLIRYLLEK